MQFTAEDPAFDGMNWYSYCGNNPGNYFDASGECYYDSNGNWSHDNWEFTGHYQRKDAPARLISVDDLNEMGFKNVTQESADELNKTLNDYQIYDFVDICQFLAQCAKETNFGTWLTEYGGKEYFDKKAYGYKYRGAGYIQLTWDYNYKKFSEAMGDYAIYTQGADYVAENYAWQVAGWFWKNNNISYKIEHGATVKDITKKVRGSFGTWEERQKYYDMIYEVLL